MLHREEFLKFRSIGTLHDHQVWWGGVAMHLYRVEWWAWQQVAFSMLHRECYVTTDWYLRWLDRLVDEGIF